MQWIGAVRLVLFAVALAATSGPALAQDRDLFLPVGTVEQGPFQELLDSDTAIAKTARLVSLDPQILAEAENGPTAWQPFELELDDALSAIVTTTSYDWLGNDLIRWVAEGDGTRLEFIIEGTNVSGSIRSGTRTFTLYGTDNPRVSRLLELDEALQLEGPDQAETGDVGPGGDELAVNPLCNADHGITIPPGKGAHPSVLILWTPAALNWLNGQHRPVATEVQQIMDLMGGAMQGTWFAVYPQLAGAQQINHAEIGPQLDPDLTALTNGSIAGVAQLRNQTRADLVLLIGHFPTATACGLAWVNDNAETANTEKHGFAVANVDVDGNTYCDLTMTAVHEVGHNFGMRHDKPNGGTSRLPYNFGFVNLPSKVRTIMAYNTQCQAQGFSCPRLSLFSDPSVMAPKGGVMGAPDAHNMELLCRTGGSIAKNR